MTEHLPFDLLNDFVDHALSADGRAWAAAHLEGCARCRRRLARLRTVVAAAPGLREPEPPPANAWPDIRDRIERMKQVSFPRPGVAPRRARLVRYSAAAVMFVVASSAVTTLVVRRRFQDPSPSPTVAAIPADFVPVERRYLNTARELEGSLSAVERTLPRATVQQVRRSLGVIDSAITEARSALASDPESSVMRDILGKRYEEKLEFLRQAAALSTGVE
jgi:hypothetical protein